MFDPDAIERMRAMQRDWEANELREFLERQPESRPEYRTGSLLPVERVYTPVDVADTALEALGLPGRYPFTRGPYPTMERGRVWTMRQIAGYGTGSDTNKRFHYLIEQGQTGLSVDFDMPTLMGYDSDDPKALGEVGREGVAVDTLDDVEALFAGIDLERISVSMTINPTARITWRATTRSTSAATTSRKPARRRCRRWRSRWRTPSRTSRRSRARACPSTGSRHAWRSTSSRRRTSSRRSRSSAPRDGSGQGSQRSASARPGPSPCVSASIARPPRPP